MGSGARRRVRHGGQHPLQVFEHVAARHVGAIVVVGKAEGVAICGDKGICQRQARILMIVGRCQGGASGSSRHCAHQGKPQNMA